MKIKNVDFLLLTTPHKIPGLPHHIKQLPIHRKDSLSLWNKFRFFLYLYTSQPDCIHSLTVLTSSTGVIIKILKFLKKFHAIQTITSLSNSHSFMLPFSIFGDVVVTLSENTARKLQNAGIAAVVIPPGVPTNIFKPAKKEKIIAFLGELYRLKSYFIVVDLVEMLKDTFPDYTIVLGFRTKNKPPQEKQLIEKLKKYFNNTATVKFLNIIEDMPLFLGKTKLVIFPATEIAGKFDYPLVLLEALASGTPIVISGIGPLKELSSLPGVATASSNSPKAFMEAVKKTIKGHTAYSRAARKTAEDNFSIERVAKKYETIYKKILY